MKTADTTENFQFNPNICDLCGSANFISLLDIKTGRSLRSDRAIAFEDLVKVQCVHCGLVRSGSGSNDNRSVDFYSKTYEVSRHEEHYFYSSEGPISRSRIICDWIIQSMGESRWQHVQNCLEVGAGAGRLLREFVNRFPGITFEGVEPSGFGANCAREDGLNVHQGDIDAVGNKRFDAIYAVAVIEHVASPTMFLKQIHAHLNPGGTLVLCQPTQDVSSYDLFFCDHLHHMGSAHLRRYATKCGYQEQGAIIGHELMPNFSLHFWSAVESPSTFIWNSQPVNLTCADTARVVVDDMKRLDAKLLQLSAQRKRVAVFGLNEVYWLACAYSSLQVYPLICGLDDDSQKPEYARLRFPVYKPEQAQSNGIDVVILAMNKLYYPLARERLRGIGVETYPVLS